VAWWKFDRFKKEAVTVSWVGEKLAELFDPAQMISTTRERHHLPPDDLKPFIALASLRMTGFEIGSSQESILSRVNKKILPKICLSFGAALIVRQAKRNDLFEEQETLVESLLNLANRVTDVFYANSNSKPPLPLPHWYAGKEICLYLQGGKGVPNPGEIMTYVADLSTTILGTKELLDDLLAAGITFV
jgi:hypothetical protein